MRLNELADRPGARRASRRLGRGIGSGTGKTAGRGHKGAKSRSGVAIDGFEGGQMPIYRRLPKRGFHNLFRKVPEIVNLGRLQRAIDAGKVDPSKAITIDNLRAAGLVDHAKDGVRLLAKGALTTKIDIEVSGASKAAIDAVEKAGGSVVVTAPAAPEKEKKQTKKKSSGAKAEADKAEADKAEADKAEADKTEADSAETAKVKADDSNGAGGDSAETNEGNAAEQEESEG